MATALFAGADAYIYKPLYVPELGGYLRVMLRRWFPPRYSDDLVTIRDLTINYRERKILLKGKEVLVSSTEFEILAYLGNHLGKPIPASELIKIARGYSCSETEAQGIIKVYVSRLRDKLDLDPNAPSYIVNIRGVGYLLERRSC
jgi:DNA-binding response OmpR family regulator